MRAFTSVLDDVIDSNERYYAGLVAEHLRSRSTSSTEVRDQSILTGRSRRPDPGAGPCPTNLILDRKEYREMAAYSRVSFYGEGPDNALQHEWQAYLSYLLRRRDFGRLAKKCVWPCGRGAFHFSVASSVNKTRSQQSRKGIFPSGSIRISCRG